MFAKKIQSVIWMDGPALREGREARRHFESIYLFSDGFSSMEQTKEAVKDLGFAPESFLYLCFCGMWYAVTLDGNDSFAVISKERVYFRLVQFGDIFTVDIGECDPSLLVVRDSPAQYTKKWQDGICLDLKAADPDLALYDPAGTLLPDTRILWNNAVIVFGLGCFIREIRITTNDYVAHVFSNYFNDVSMQYEYETIEELRKQGYEYYNPFLKTFSETESEKRKKEKALLKGIKVPPMIKREEVMPGVKLMREREKHPCRVLDRTDRIFWRRYGR